MYHTSRLKHDAESFHSDWQRSGMARGKSIALQSSSLQYRISVINTVFITSLEAFKMAIVRFEALTCYAGSLSTQDKHSLWARLAACLAYAFMSISITLFNKAVFSIYKFPFPAFVTTLQIVVSIFYMLVLHYARFMDLGTSWSFKTARQVSPRRITLQQDDCSIDPR